MVCEHEQGLSLDKVKPNSDWSRRLLDADQVNYAALDAEVLLVRHQQIKAVGRAPDLGKRPA